MRSEMPRLDGLFRGRLSSLRFGVVVWAVQAVTLVLWLFNSYLEWTVFAQLSLHTGFPNPVVETPPLLYLPLVGESAVMAVILYLLYRRASKAFEEYRFRLDVARASPDVAGLYSVANPFVYGVRDLLDIDVLIFGVIVVCGLTAAFGYSMLLFGAMTEFSFFLTLSRLVPVDMTVFSEMMNVWMRRFVFYGVNALLMWVFTFWSGLSLFKTRRMSTLVGAKNMEKPLDSTSS